MGKAVSRGQALQTSARVATQVDWDKLDGDRLQVEVINLTPDEFGRRFTAFLKNGARFIIDPKVFRISSTQPFNPNDFIGKGNWVVEEQDERSLSIDELDLSKIQFEDNLKEDEIAINGEEKLVRLKAMEQVIRLGGNQCFALWQDYEANGENSGLEWLRRNLNITCMDFFGLILRHPNGGRYVFELSYDGKEWRISYIGLDHDWSVDSPSAVYAE